MPKEQHPDDLLDTEQCSREEFNGSPSRRTLIRWRQEGSGPPYAKVGQRVYYRRGDVREWIAQRRVVPVREDAA